MRVIITTLPLALLALAGCSSGGGEDNQTAAPVALQAGLWEIRTEVESGRNLDSGKAVLPIEAGHSETKQICLAAADTAKPQAVMFAPTMESCDYTNTYLSEGRLNVTMNCKLPGQRGAAGATVSGSFTDTTIEARQTVETALVADGDVSVVSKLTGKRLGDCPPEGTPPATKG